MHRTPPRSLIALALLITAALLLPPMTPPAAPVAAQTDYTPELYWDTCLWPVPAGEIVGETMHCGYLQVPQDRTNPDGPWIELALVVLEATGPDPAPDPLLYLEGGPGGSAIAGLDLWPESPFRQRRDIILLDQRGTGYSYPRLYCYELDEVNYEADVSEDELLAAEADARAACLARLKDELAVDLPAYNSAASAADIADLRAALGVAEWNLLGISYGTRLALTVMRDYPAGVRSVILDSTYPPQVDAWEEDAPNAYRSFRVLFDDCAADAACRAAYPDLERRFLALVERWNADPVVIPDLDETYAGDDLVEFMFTLFYETVVIPYLPLLIDELDRGVFDAFIALYDGGLPGQETDWDDGSDDPVLLWVDDFYYLSEALDDADYEALWDELAAWDWDDTDALAEIVDAYFDADDANYLIAELDSMTPDQHAQLGPLLWFEDVADTDGFYDAVECNEELPFNAYDEAVALADTLPEPLREGRLLGFELQADICVAWPSGAAAPVEDEPVSSPIPTLVLAGEYDPVTPPAWGAQAADYLPNSTFLTFPGVGHSVIDGGACPLSIAVAFVDAPTVAPDTGCMAALAGPAFVTP